MRRFSFYQDPSVWSGDIVENPKGEWARWKDVEPYIPEEVKNTPEPEVTPLIRNDATEAPRQSADDFMYTEEEYEQAMDDLLHTEDVYEFMRRQHYGQPKANES